MCAACAPSPGDGIAFALDGIPAFALGAYDGALRRAVVAMKRGERDPLATFAALLARAPLPLHGPLVPLPTTRRRAAARGFDQAVVLARRLARLRGAACAELLVKRGRAQEGRGRRDRLAATARFRIRPAANALPRVVTLLDDVCTTGATLRDAVGTLSAAGTSVCGIVVVARAADDLDGTHRRRGRS
ncbi:MAG: hypothetical protein NVS3B7_03210 [Candidatus Elarobacter sp.]